MARRVQRLETPTTPEVPEIPAPPAVAEVPLRRRYRALADFQATLPDGTILIRKGQRFSSDEIPFDPAVMEPLDG